jgi:hypothetical protein
MKCKAVEGGVAISTFINYLKFTNTELLQLKNIRIKQGKNKASRK